MPPPSSGTQKARPGSAEDRAARKVLARVEKQLARILATEAKLDAEMADHLGDYERLADLGKQLSELAAQRGELEMEWLEASETVE